MTNTSIEAVCLKSAVWERYRSPYRRQGVPLYHHKNALRTTK